MTVQMNDLKDWRFEIDFEDIAWATFDRENESANTLGRRPTEELEAIITRVEEAARYQDRGPGGVEDATRERKPAPAEVAASDSPAAYLGGGALAQLGAVAQGRMQPRGVVLAALGWWFFRTGKHIGSQKGYQVGRRHRRRPRRR